MARARQIGRVFLLVFFASVELVLELEGVCLYFPRPMHLSSLCPSLIYFFLKKTYSHSLNIDESRGKEKERKGPCVLLLLPQYIGERYSL